MHYTINDQRQLLYIITVFNSFDFLTSVLAVLMPARVASKAFQRICLRLIYFLTVCLPEFIFIFF